MHILGGGGGSQYGLCSQADLASNPGSALDFFFFNSQYILFILSLKKKNYLASLGLSYSMRDLVP